MTTTRARLSFRSRLSIIITVVFVAAGAGLLTVQYLVVQGLFASAFQVTAMSCANIVTGPYDDTMFTQETGPGCATLSVAAQGSMPISGMPAELTGVPAQTATGAVLQQTRFISDEVIGGLLVSSIVMLVVFAGIAAAIASWLARRSLDRIGEVTAAARDISERDLGRRLDLPGPDDEIKELGDTIDGMLDRLQLAFAAQDRFVANASHELRTPLTTTRTALEIPLEHGDVPKKLEPAIRRALRATEQSEQLISALLSLSRGRAGADDFGDVDLELVVTTEIDELAHEATARGVTVRASTQSVAVSGDATLLARAVRNLLDNGIRHNVDGGQLWVRMAGSSIEVESTGELLDAETVSLLTEPFYRGAASRTSAHGIGLGLAIVDSIALTHGGSLELAPRFGGGLIATLTLPALAREEFARAGDN